MGLSINAAGEVQPCEQDLQTLYKILDPSQIVSVHFQIVWHSGGIPRAAVILEVDGRLFV